MEINPLTGGEFKPAPPTADKGKDGKLRQACADFEAIILQKFLSMSREAGFKSDLLDGGHSQEMYQSLHDQELAQHLAADRGMGFGEQLYRQISQQHNSGR